MASFKNLGSGSIRTFVCVSGVRDTQTFKSKQKAKSRARDWESELSKMGSIRDDSCTFGDMFKRYSEEVSPAKKRSHWEIIGLKVFARDFKTLSAVKLVKAKKSDIKEWISEHTQTVASSTINRDLNLISHCLTYAREEWEWMSHNPLQGLKRPKNPKARNRRINDKEVKEFCLALGYREDTELTFKREFVCVTFLFAIETAMRAGGICSLTRSNINKR